MVKANGLVIIPEEMEWVKAGEKVRVQLLDRNF
jgi:molybdopterin biosynthesis enzyme